MKKYIKFILILCVLAITVGACEDTGTDDGDNRTPVVSFGAPVIVTMENISPLRLAVVLSKPAVSPVSVKVGVKSEDGAKEGVNYRIVSKELQIAKGASTAYIEMELVDDTEQNADRIVELEIVSVTGATISDKVKTCRVTIQSDEGYPTVGFTEALVSVPEEGVSYTLPVTLNRKAQVDMTFTLKTANGSALEDEHFTIPVKEFTIAKGDSVAYVEIGIIDDDIVNDNRIFELEIAEATNAVVSEIYNKCKITIVNDERLAYVSFDKTSYKVYEHSGTLTIPVSVSGDPAGDVNVKFALKAGGTAIEGTNFEVSTYNLKFPKGTRAGELTVKIKDDLQTNPDYNFTLEINEIEGALKPEKDTACTVTIMNADVYDFLLGTWELTNSAPGSGAAASAMVTVTDGDDPDNLGKRVICQANLKGDAQVYTWKMECVPGTRNVEVIMLETMNTQTIDGYQAFVKFCYWGDIVTPRIKVSLDGTTLKWDTGANFLCLGVWKAENNAYMNTTIGWLQNNIQMKKVAE